MPTEPRTPYIDIDATADDLIRDHGQPHDECRAPILHSVIEKVRGAAASAGADPPSHMDVTTAKGQELLDYIDNLADLAGDGERAVAFTTAWRAIRARLPFIEREARAQGGPSLDVTALAEADHEWSQANGHIRCAAHYVPVRPCTPEDHMEWAASIAARLGVAPEPEREDAR